MSSTASTGAISLADPELAFSGTIAPTRISAAYRFGLVVAAVTMLLLPILYVGLIAVTGAAVWWHVTENAGMLSGRSGLQGRLLLYVTPAIVGLVLMFFMVKPILARPSARQEPLPIDADAEPALFAFIGEICRQVRAPNPRRVYVDCTPNASAGFMGGRLNLLRGDLVLTIGLPLAAGLSIRQLAGVLAHEFGHFAQGGGMRLTATVRGVNAWFARVVYERDAWDERLEQWSKETDWRLAVVIVIARGAVSASRWVLTGLMLGGHAISCFMMRQMEYDADSYEIKIAGTDAFIRTSARLRELGVATHIIHNDMREALDGGTLPENLPTLVVERSRHIPADLLALIRSEHDEKTGVFDTHPCDADRVRAAEAAGASGVLVGADAPATLLFRNFDALSAAATRHYFEHDLGLSLGAVTLVNTTAALRASRAREENFTAIRRFFDERYSPHRPLHLPVRELEALGARELGARLASARDAMTAAAADVTPRYAEFDALEIKRQMAFAAGELLAAGFESVNADDFDLADGTPAGEADERALNRQRDLAPALEAFEAAAAIRLACALVLLGDSADKARVPGLEIGSMVDASNALAGVMPDLRELRRLDTAAILVEQNAPSSPWPEQTAAHLRLLERKVANRREKVRTGLAGVACPSAFAVSPTTMAERCGLPSEGPLVSASEVIDLYAQAVLRNIGAARSSRVGTRGVPSGRGMSSPAYGSVAPCAAQRTTMVPVNPGSRALLWSWYPHVTARLKMADGRDWPGESNPTLANSGQSE